MSDKPIRGRVFDIRRFSVHDGDGIRTTLFLKGCPLSCKWCQNPEGISPDPHLFYFRNKCIRCGQCVAACPNGALRRNKEGYIEIDRNACTLNLDCVDVCPTRALAVDSTLITSQEAVREALSDLPFFRHGGGVTLSGGEPFYQFGFMLDILKRLKAAGVDTAVESSLFVPKERLFTALPYIDTLFADCKILDSEAHEAATGVPNGLILQNLEAVLKTDQRVVVRTPLIPGYTARSENLRAIARWLHGIRPDVTYELLNYNPLAANKYRLLEQDYIFPENPPLYTSEQMEAFRNLAREEGLMNVI